MAYNTIDGTIDEVDSTTTDATVTDSSTVEKDNAENLDNTEKTQDNSGSEDQEESYEELLQKLKDDGVSLNKIKRFQKLNERAKLATEYETKLKTLESSKPEAKEEKQEEKQETTSQPANDLANIDQAIESVLSDDSDLTFKEYVFDEAGNVKEGGYKTYNDMFKDFFKATVKKLTKVSELGKAKEEKLKAETERYYNELDTELKETFTDDTGILDEEAFNTYMDVLKADHAKTPVENVRKHLAKYLRTQASKPAPKQEKPQEKEEIAGRNTRNADRSGDYIPGQANPFASI